MTADTYPDKITKMTIHRQQYPGKNFISLRVVIGDLHLHHDMMGERDYSLAIRLAESHGVDLDCCDPEAEEMVRMAKERREARRIKLGE